MLELGFRQAHERHGLAVDEGLIARVPRPLEEVGEAAAAALLARPEPPTAIVVGSDLLALGVYDAVRRRGLTIPDDCAVVGFDDQDFAARLSPPLSSVHLSYYDLGEAAVRLLFDVLEGQRPASPVVVDVSLVPRASSLGAAGGRPAREPAEEVVPGARQPV